MHPNEAHDRQEQLDEVVAAWRAAPRTAANDERLAKWLRSAIRTSMPGQREALPPIPDFNASARVTKQAAESAPTESTPSTTAEKRDSEVSTSEASDAEPTLAIDSSTATDEMTDPFRDDPIDEQE
jgi:hypothetical protein